MSDYDIDKVSPRPWGVVPHDSIENTDAHIVDNSNTHLIVISEGYDYSEGFFGKADAAHIVHCVNTHDRLEALAALVPGLVEALESIAYLAAKGIDYARDERTYEQAKQTLAAARAAMEATDAP